MMTSSICAPPGTGESSRKDNITEIYSVEKCREATVVQGLEHAIEYKVPRSRAPCGKW
jgi:hypothetical protein